MNYKKIYDDLIEKARSENRKRRKRNHKDYIYYEQHHIIPRCLGGDNSKENLVFLTAREHFIAHKLLVEIYPDNKSLFHAFWMMINGCEDKNQRRDYRISSREYGRIKLLYSDMMSIKMKGRLVGEKNPMYNRKGDKNHFYKKKHSKEFIEKMRVFSSSREEIECPWCHTIMNYANAKQYHFDNCYLSPNITKQNLDKKKNKMKAAINSSMKKIQCPHCNKSCSKSNASKYHFENCEKAPVLSQRTINRIRDRELSMMRRKELAKKEPKLYKCQYCGLESYDWTNMHKYHFENCKLNSDRKVKLYKCEYCDVETENKTNIVRFHNDNCKHNPNKQNKTVTT